MTMSSRLKLVKNEERRERLTPQISRELKNQVRAYAAARNTTISKVTESALLEFFDDSGQEQWQATLARRLRNLDNAIASLTWHNQLLQELLGQFMLEWFKVTHEVPLSQQQAALRHAQRRLKELLESSAFHLNDGKSILGGTPPESFNEEG